MKKQLLKKMLSLLISYSVLLGSGFCVMADEADKEQPEDVDVVTDDIGSMEDDSGWIKDSAGWRYKTAEGDYLKDGWFCLDGFWYFFNSNGYIETNCWKEREADSWYKDPDWYYLDENGACCVGWKNISGKWYFFNLGFGNNYSDKGKMYSDGIYAIEEVVGIVEGKTIKAHRDYYFNKSGAMQTGWIDYQGKRYYAFSNGQLAETLVSIDGCYYLFDRYDNYLIETVGEKSNGWILAGGEYYYVDSDGVLTTGYAWINGKYYHFDEKGVMLTCELESYTDEPSPVGAPGDTHYRYFGEDGAMVTSEFKYLSIRVYYPDYLLHRDGPIVDYDSVPPIDGWYYFDEDGDMLFGDQIIDGRKYLFDSPNGYLITRDWEYINGDWYYYKNEESVTGWLKISDKWYYFEQSGVMQTGWHQTEGKWYYLSDDGAMVTGWNWQKISGKWYYFAPDGAMFTGWHKDGNTWYYFDKSGAMKTGWYFSDNSWYYFDDSGAMVTGTVKLSDGTYEFDDSGACQNPYSPK